MPEADKTLETTADPVQHSAVCLPAGVFRVTMLLLAASFLYFVVLAVSNGTYAPQSLAATLPIGPILLGAVFLARPGLLRSSRWLTIIVLGGMAGFCIAIAVLPNLQVHAPWGATPAKVIAGFSVIISVVLFIAILLYHRPGKWQTWLVGVIAIAQLCVAGWAISQKVLEIDVLVFHRDASKALLAGRNPYAIDFPNVYMQYPMDQCPYYSPQVQHNGRLLFGYPYPPLSLVLNAISDTLLRDARYGLIAAYLIAAVLITQIGRGPISFCAGALMLLSPSSWYLFVNGWTEPQLILGLAAVVWCALYRRPWLPVALGLFFALKQYTIVILPLLPLVLPAPFWSKQTMKQLGVMFLTIVIVSLPLAVWDWPAFWNSNVRIQLMQPFRNDSLSYQVWIAQLLGHEPAGASAIGFALLLPLYPILLWKLPRNPAGFALGVAMTLFVFLMFNRQAFANYHTLAACSIALAAAAYEAVYSARSAATLAADSR